MITVTEFEHEFMQSFPQVYEILKNAPFTVHEGIAKVIMHQTRGFLAGDLELYLLIDHEQYPQAKEDEELLKDIIFTTLASWREKTKLDLIVVFDQRNCQLKCFNEKMYNPSICTGGGFDCFGMYTVQDGKPGYLLNSGMNIRYIYPCITVWKNPRLLR